MLDKRITFDERHDSKETNLTTLFFKAPKEMINNFIPFHDTTNDIGMEISIEFPTDYPKNYFVSISPTAEIDGCISDYDWFDVNIPNDTVKELMKLAGVTYETKTYEWNEWSIIPELHDSTYMMDDEEPKYLISDLLLMRVSSNRGYEENYVLGRYINYLDGTEYFCAVDGYSVNGDLIKWMYVPE